MKTTVHYRGEPPSNLEDPIGYNGPGWYFTDIDDDGHGDWPWVIHGPYATSAAAARHELGQRREHRGITTGDHVRLWLLRLWVKLTGRWS